MPAEHLLLDYFRLPEVELAQTALVKGDQRSLSIACASILAKTARDAACERRKCNSQVMVLHRIRGMAPWHIVLHWGRLAHVRCTGEVLI
jgi:hypothetical protein